MSRHPTIILLLFVLQLVQAVSFLIWGVFFIGFVTFSSYFSRDLLGFEGAIIGFGIVIVILGIIELIVALSLLQLRRWAWFWALAINIILLSGSLGNFHFTTGDTKLNTNIEPATKVLSALVSIASVYCLIRSDVRRMYFE
jgi:hypothetical protein